MRPKRIRHFSLDWLESRMVLSAYFVSTAGNDGAAGTSGAPWRTLQHAADSVAAGDFVTVQSGNYAGFYLETDGTAAQPITFHALPGVIIDTRNAVTPDGINLEGADWIVIDGFELRGLTRAGIRSVINEHVTIRNNIADSNGRWGIFTGFSDDLLIENNVASHSGLEHGIYVSNSGDRPVIRGNTVFGNYANGIHMNGDLSQGGDGIISGALVENNIIYDNGVGGGSGINADGVQNSRFQNNVLYNNHASGISLYRIDGAAGSNNNVVVNNTIVMASNSRWAINIRDGSTGNHVVNNILYNNHSWHGSISISADSLAGFSSDYNVVMERFTTDDGDSVLDLSHWRSATGQDQHSVVATPGELFVDVAGNDYHLSSTSPAIDAGTASQAPDVDREGAARPAGAGFDIGAFEAGAAPGTGPNARDDAATVLEDSSVQISVIANDSIPSGSSWSVSIASNPTHGTVTLNAGTATYRPARGFTGTDSFTYLLDDGAGGTDTATVVVTVNAKRNTVELEPDPWASGVNPLPALVIRATAAADKISITRSSSSVAVKMNGQARGSFSGFGRIIVLGHEGADLITLASTITTPSEIVGGTGNDSVTGGGGSDLILGGLGNDQLAGGPGSDVLVGGDGADKLTGGLKKSSGADSDLLISSATSYDGVDTALRDIMNTWSSALSYAQRTNALKNGTGGVPILDSSSVAADSYLDELRGATDLDWFFASVPQDILRDRSGTELLN